MALPVAVRRAAAADADAVWPLAKALATTFSPTERAFRLTFTDVLAEPSALVLVAGAAEGRTGGYLLAHRHRTFFADAPVVWVEELMVAPDLRRTGVGAALMAAAEQWAVESAAAYVALATRRAADFYAALGYEESATFFRKLLR